MILGVDIETGGLSPYSSVLSIGMIIFNDNLEEVEACEWLVRPEDGEYNVNAQALEINKINLIDHDKNAISEKLIGTEIYEFIKQHSKNGKEKLIPLGHNVQFDIRRIVKGDGHFGFIKQETWNQFVSYRVLDTGVIAQALRRKGYMPNELKGSLSSLMDYFNLEWQGQAHSALADVRAAADVLEAMEGMY